MLENIQQCSRWFYVHDCQNIKGKKVHEVDEGMIFYEFCGQGLLQIKSLRGNG